jgi:hypothetical protein
VLRSAAEYVTAIKRIMQVELFIMDQWYAYMLRAVSISGTRSAKSPFCSVGMRDWHVCMMLMAVPLLAAGAATYAARQL